MSGRIETAAERAARLEAPWMVIHFEIQDTSTISTDDDNDLVIARVHGAYRRDITERMVRDHNGALSATQRQDEAGELREALEEIRGVLDHLYSDHTSTVARLPDDLLKYAGPLSIIDRVTTAALAQPSEGAGDEHGG
jgi:hypothetical protein